MTDAEIRAAFHRKKLRREHHDPDSLVIDELGLQYGKCRADIAIVGRQLVGYEIKSDVDSLRRLDQQIRGYSSVFDEVSLVVGQRFMAEAASIIPQWWGIIVARLGPRGAIHFGTIKVAENNPRVDNYSVLQLLWRTELIGILSEMGLKQDVFRQRRSVLCQTLVACVEPETVRNLVRSRLTQRREWRDRR